MKSRFALVISLVTCFTAAPCFADATLDQAFLLAARTQSAKQVEDLLQQGAMIEAQDSRGRTALYLAASRNDLEIVAALLARGANPNTPNQDGYTPLMQTLSPAIAELLISHHADVNARASDGATALMLQGSHYAKDRAVLEAIARMLLANGAQVDAVDREGDGALTEATTQGNFDLVRLLVDAGANVTVHNAKGIGPIDIAILFAPAPPAPDDTPSTKSYHAISDLLRAHGAKPVGKVVMGPQPP